MEQIGWHGSLSPRDHRAAVNQLFSSHQLRAVTWIDKSDRSAQGLLAHRWPSVDVLCLLLWDRRRRAAFSCVGFSGAAAGNGEQRNWLSSEWGPSVGGEQGQGKGRGQIQRLRGEWGDKACAPWESLACFQRQEDLFTHQGAPSWCSLISLWKLITF